MNKTYEDAIEDFSSLVARYDFYYEMSDDHRYWVAGKALDAKIAEASKELTPDDAAKYWNEMIDTRLNHCSTDAKEPWYNTAEYWLNKR